MRFYLSALALLSTFLGASCAAQPSQCPRVSASLCGALDGAIIFKLTSESIAVIRTDAGMQGSAVAVASTPGHGTAFATNCHVLLNATSVFVRTKRGKAPALLFGADPKHDTCIVFAELDAPVPDRFNALDLLPGEKVYAIGAPKGLDFTITEGIFSARRGDFLFEPPLLLQNTAPISPGSSGGALFDARGRLIGITTSQLRDAQGLNFAIAINMYNGLMERTTIISFEELTQAINAIKRDAPIK